jgi:hypothetical protein
MNKQGVGENWPVPSQHLLKPLFWDETVYNYGLWLNGLVTIIATVLSMRRGVMKLVILCNLF